MHIYKFIFAGIFLLSLAASPAWALDCSNPPSGFGNAWWSKYASWCSQCGGTPDSSTTSCTPGANWGNSGNAGSPGGGGYSGYGTGDLQTEMSLYLMEQTLPIFFNAIGQQIACEFDPNCPRKVRQRQLEEQQRLEREARQRMAEEERRRQKIERRARFEQTKERLIGEMRLQPGSGELQPRNIRLETREVTGGLQIRTLAPRNLSSGSTLRAVALRSPLARASCGVFLLNKSGKAAAVGNYQEAAFLSNEAAALISGEKIISAVECPPPPEVPGIGEGVQVNTEEYKKKSREIQTALKQRSRFVSGMYQRVVEQGAQYSEASVAVRQAEKRKQVAQVQLKVAQAAKAEIEVRLQHQPLPAVVDAAPLTMPGPTPPDPAIESALAEALEALKVAEEAYAEADTDLQSGQDQMAGLEIQMQETRSLFDEVKQNPNTLDEALEKMAVKETKP